MRRRLHPCSQPWCALHSQPWLARARGQSALADAHAQNLQTTHAPINAPGSVAVPETPTTHSTHVHTHTCTHTHTHTHTHTRSRYLAKHAPCTHECPCALAQRWRPHRVRACLRTCVCVCVPVCACVCLCVRVCARRLGGVRSTVLSSDSRLLIVGGVSGALGAWRLDDSTLATQFETAGAAVSCAVVASNELLIGTQEGQLAAYAIDPEVVYGSPTRDAAVWAHNADRPRS
eukprot:6201960-Pleurochrysis_carterae.AAC.1